MKAKGLLCALAPAIIAATFFVSSCKDTTGPCDAVITVKDSLGQKIAGATVIIHPDSSVYSSGNPGVDSSVTQTGITNNLGQVTFTFRLEAVLIVDATKGVKSGRDYVRLESAKTVAKTVVIR